MLIMGMRPIHFDLGLEDEALEETVEEEESSEEDNGSPLPKRAKTEDEESDSDGFNGPTPTKEQMDKYYAYQNHVQKYHGFHVDMSLWPEGVAIIGGIEAMDIENDATLKADVHEAARRAIKMHKTQNPKSPELELVRVIRANTNCYVLFITMVVRDVDSGKEANYQAAANYAARKDGSEIFRFFFLRPEPKHHRVEEGVSTF
ncbi:unnamed protein product [Cuscuta epithymum]|uniref:Cystatin domain-containing protein n=1 Tax=Cuscuta epithymum TaxID=186058 RepID=A0AAV0GC05_9ASTE|nr:unnamed protein product [Cuscuta epithymum]